MQTESPSQLDSAYAPMFGVAVLLGFGSWLAAQIWSQVTRENLPDHCANGCKVSIPWVAVHPIWTGLIAFAATLLVLRLLLFMSRIESRRA